MQARVGNVVKERLYAVACCRGEKTQMAEVDSRHGGMLIAQAVDTLEQGAIASQAHHDGLLGLVARGVGVNLCGGYGNPEKLLYNSCKLLIYSIIKPVSLQKRPHLPYVISRMRDLRTGKKYDFHPRIEKKMSNFTSPRRCNRGNMLVKRVFISLLYHPLSGVLLCKYNDFMTKLSVNVNKIAVLRNSRGGDVPNVVRTALDIERFGAEGITVHPRPDARHIRYDDVRDLKQVISTELNIEGNPIPSFVDLVMEVRPAQVTLVPDAEDAITSNAGWDTVRHRQFLKDICSRFNDAGIRTSIFVDPVVEMVEAAVECEAQRVELYTEAYAAGYKADREAAIAPYVEAAEAARRVGLGLNAGHDLSLENLTYFAERIGWCDEVSIGHALISDALYYGWENTIQLYRRCLLPSLK